MNKYILIEVNNNIKRFITKCNKYNICLYNIKYINKDRIIAKINKEDYDNIKIYNYYSNINIYKKLGIDNIKEKIFDLKYLILIFIICIISMYFISNIIIKINVIHSNKKIRDLVYEELNNYGIKKYSYKKNYNELENIKNKILDNNKDKLEWISITRNGMTYIIRVEERIIDKINKTNNYCNVISNKEALITKIYSNSGDIIINVNDLVKKGDLLISGDLKLNEELKNKTCASGKVMGQVWYTINTNMDLKYYKKKYTGKKRLNIEINNKILRSNKYTKYDKSYIINKKYLKIYKELEYKEIEYFYKDKEAENILLDKLTKSINIKLKDKGKVINKKILSKYINNNKIYLNVFITTEEDISKQIIIE